MVSARGTLRPGRGRASRSSLAARGFAGGRLVVQRTRFDEHLPPAVGDDRTLVLQLGLDVDRPPGRFPFARAGIIALLAGHRIGPVLDQVADDGTLGLEDEAVPAGEAITSSELWKALIVMIVAAAIVYGILSLAPASGGSFDFN